MRRLGRILAAAALLLWAAPAQADQTDPRLDALFDALRSTPDYGVAQGIDAQIWRIWLQHPDKRTQESLLIGIAFMNKGQTDLAALAFKEAIERSPKFAEAWNKRATLRYLVGDLTGSVADCAQVLALEPRHFGALSGLGLIHAALKDWAAAIRWYKAALAINPHMPGVEASLAEAERRLKGEET